MDINQKNTDLILNLNFKNSNYNTDLILSNKLEGFSPTISNSNNIVCFKTKETIKNKNANTNSNNNYNFTFNNDNESNNNSVKLIKKFTFSNSNNNEYINDQLALINNKKKFFFKNYKNIEKFYTFEDTINDMNNVISKKAKSSINSNSLLDSLYLSLENILSYKVDSNIIDFYANMLNEYIQYSNKYTTDLKDNRAYFFDTNIFNFIQNENFIKIKELYINFNDLFKSYEVFVIPIIYYDVYNHNNSESMLFIAKFDILNVKITLYDPSDYLLSNSLIGINIFLIYNIYYN